MEQELKDVCPYYMEKIVMEQQEKGDIENE